MNLDSTMSEAAVTKKTGSRPLLCGSAMPWSWESTTVIVIGLMIVIGFGLRLAGLGRIGFAEDEINKLDAVRAYDRGDFTANAEHPVLMKAMIDVSMHAARTWNSRTGQAISDEAALRFPNALFGALTAIPLFLLPPPFFYLPTPFSP